MPDQSVENEDIKKILESLSNKRARIVIEHILQHGFITTEQLEKDYGYNHPPRAARDVREAGIPLETFRVKDSGGRSIAAYRFGNIESIRGGQFAGRRTFPKKFRDELYIQCNGKCAICNGTFESRYLQVDHRIPYEIAGEFPGDLDSLNFMLLCGSCNRAKSWSCEHCINWQKDKIPEVCLRCYWANPENYAHIALQEVRRLDILWNENEVGIYEKIKESAQQAQTPIPDYVKKVIEMHFKIDSD